MLSPGDINTKKFEKAAFGYRADDVDHYLTAIAEEYARVMHENDELEKKLGSMAVKIEEYQQQEKSLSAALLGAQKMSDQLLNEAKEKVTQIIGEANSRAQKIIESAQAEVQRERSELLRVQQEISTFKNKLLSMYKSQIDLIKALPDADRSRREEPKAEEKRFVYNNVQEVEEVSAVVQETDSVLTQKPAEPSQIRAAGAPKGFVPNLADDEIANSVYQPSFGAKNEKTEKPAGITIPFESAKADEVKLAADTSSKFGELKFGAAYDFNRDTGFGAGKRKKH